MNMQCTHLYMCYFLFDDLFPLRFRLGRGVSSTDRGPFLFLVQLPLRGSSAAEPCTRRDTVLSRNSLTDGLSLRPPLYLCFPKKASTGSWLNLSLNRYVTPGTLSN